MACDLDHIQNRVVMIQSSATGEVPIMGEVLRVCVACAKRRSVTLPENRQTDPGIGTT